MANARFPEFVRSTEYRRELGMRRKRAIQKMYSDIAKETENKINAIQRAGKWTGTTVLQMKQLRDLQKSIDDSLKNISAQIEKDIVSDMKKVAEVTCADVAGMMKRIGVNVGAAYAHVPDMAVKNIVSGNLYGQRWSFSKAVWGDYRKASGDVAQIVARGLAQNRPIYDIAKDLEKYVNPNVRKDFDWSKRYPGSKKKVDYNAYRLAQTMSTHAHQQAVILSCKDDPLIDGVEWRSSGGVNVCPLCEQRNGEVFPLDKCPMDHPMGACILVPHFKGTKIDEKTGKLIEPDFHSEAAKVDGDELRKEFEAEKARLRAEREAKKATAVNNAASSNASVNNAAEKLAQMQKASDELGKAVKDFGKSVDGFEKAVGNLQNAAKGVTENISYMSKSFRPKFSSCKPITFKTDNFGVKEIQVKRVSNSRYDIITDIDTGRRNKAIRLVERQLDVISKTLPEEFELPTIAIVDFERNGLNTSAIGGFDRTSGILYINRRYNSSKKILDFVNEEAGMFANKTEFAPLRHELGHKFYEDCIKRLAKSENLSYNKAKDIIDDKIYEYIHFRNDNGNFLVREISIYAQDGFDSGKHTEVIAESFSVYLENQTATEIINLLK